MVNEQAAHARWVSIRIGDERLERRLRPGEVVAVAVIEGDRASGAELPDADAVEVCFADRVVRADGSAGWRGPVATYLRDDGSAEHALGHILDADYEDDLDPDPGDSEIPEAA